MAEIPRERLPGFPVDACYEAFEQVWDFLDGNLPEAEVQAMLAHLEICAQCRDFGAFQEAFRTALTRVRERLTAPPSLRQRVLGTLANDGFGGS